MAFLTNPTGWGQSTSAYNVRSGSFLSDSPTGSLLGLGYPEIANAMVSAVAGTVKVKFANGETGSVYLPQGVVVPIAVTQIFSSNSTITPLLMFDNGIGGNGGAVYQGNPTSSIAVASSSFAFTFAYNTGSTAAAIPFVSASLAANETSSYYTGATISSSAQFSQGTTQLYLNDEASVSAPAGYYASGSQFYYISASLMPVVPVMSTGLFGISGSL